MLGAEFPVSAVCDDVGDEVGAAADAEEGAGEGAAEAGEEETGGIMAEGCGDAVCCTGYAGFSGVPVALKNG